MVKTGFRGEEKGKWESRCEPTESSLWRLLYWNKVLP